MDINVCLFTLTSHPPRVVFMSDSSGEIDLFFDMPPGKRMSSERRFDMNSEYERGRPGVRAHLLGSGPYRRSRSCVTPWRHEPPGMRRSLKGPDDGSDEGLEFLGQLRSSFRTEIRAINEILCRLQDQRRCLRAAEPDRLSEVRPSFLENSQGIFEGLFFRDRGMTCRGLFLHALVIGNIGGATKAETRIDREKT